MNVPISVLNGVVDDGMLVVFVQTIIGFQFIGKDSRTSFDVLPDLLLQFALASIVNYKGPNISAPLYHAHDNGFVFSASSGE